MSSMDNTEHYVVLGTAGHIDHGKTTLIKALTGIDCDTLAEEKARGITIVLGFAHMELPGGVRLGIVDVPGHRKFIRSMVSGAAGIDLVMLIVSADDGVMPQTREHLDITRMLGVKHGLVAITKTDLVDEEILELVMADVEEFVEGSFLEGCPVIPVSSTTGAGLDELKQAIADTAAKVPRHTVHSHFRLPIDRVFTVKGVGTVVTGTTLDGRVRVDDELELVPTGKRARIRTIEVHGEPVKECGAGFRAAFNLVGLDKDDLTRGLVLATPDTLKTTFMLDAEIELLADAQTPLNRGSEVMLHTGTTELTAKVFPLEEDVVVPGSQALIQLRLREEVAVIAGDPVILRNSSSEFTIGGGRVLDAHPSKHKRKRQEAAKQLADINPEDQLKLVIHEVEKSQFGIDRTTIESRLHLLSETMDRVLDSSAASSTGLMFHKTGNRQILTAPANRQRIVKAALAAIKAHHEANPLVKQGLGAKELVKAIDRQGTGVPVDVIVPALSAAVESGELTMAGETYALPNLDSKLTAKDEQAIDIILRELNVTNQPEQPDKLMDKLPVDRKRAKQLVNYLLEEGRIVSQTGMFFGLDVVDRARSALLRHFKNQPSVTISEFGKLLGISRKYSVPLLQVFDQNGMILRDGDARKLNPEWNG